MNLRPARSRETIEANLVANSRDVLEVLAWVARRYTSTDPETARHAREARALLRAMNVETAHVA